MLREMGYEVIMADRNMDIRNDCSLAGPYGLDLRELILT